MKETKKEHLFRKKKKNKINISRRKCKREKKSNIKKLFQDKMFSYFHGKIIFRRKKKFQENLFLNCFSRENKIQDRKIPGEKNVSGSKHL